MNLAHRRSSLAAVGRVPDERAFLYEIIQTIGSGPDLPAILRGVVRLVTEATACHACFVYFLHGDRLELRAASRMYEHLEGMVSIPLGKGLTGWVASTRRSAFIKENALEDPRVRRASFPELGDEVYQSLVSVPIFARSGGVIGAITLHAEAPHEFTREDLDFLEHTASLIGGAVENARLYEEATARVATLSALSRLSQQIASADGTEAVLSAVTDGAPGLLRAERCEIYLLDPGGRPRLAARFSQEAETAPSDPQATSLVASAAEQTRLSTEDAGRLAQALWGPDHEGVPMFAPLVAGEERLGLLAVLGPDPVPDAQATVVALAAHTAVAIRQHQVIGWLRERNLVKDFFLALSRPDEPTPEVFDLAARLGCDLDSTHLVLHAIRWTGPTKVAGRPRARGGRRAEHRALSWPETTSQVEARLAARFPGMLFDRLERSVRALIPVGRDTAEDVGAIREMDWGVDGEDGLSVGTSNPCLGAASYSRGFEEAEAAAEVGALIRGSGGVTTYEDLGPYRYVLRSTAGVRDRFQDRLERLVEYDRKRNAQLLDTLESYLDHRGNVVATARALYIHPNTLRQRVGRIERVSELDVDHDDWLSLAVATKIVKLRSMRSIAGEGGR